MYQRQSKEAILHQAIGSLYEAATTSERWGPALDRLCPIFGSVAAHYFVWNRVLDRPVASQGSTTYLGQKKALQYYLRIDPRRLLLSHYPVGSTLLCHEHFDEVFVQHNEYFRDYSLPLGRRFLMGANLLQNGPTSSIFAFLRSPQQGPFGSEEYALFERLRPELERVARIHWRYMQAHQDCEFSQNILDGLPSCIVVTDGAACILRVNQAATRMLDDGGVLRAVSGRLVAPTSPQTAVLHQLIRQATAVDEIEIVNGGCTIIEDRSCSRHVIMITRLNNQSTISGKSASVLALVTLNNLTPHTGSDRPLIDIFGLTPAEAKLADAVASGKRLDAVANERGVRMSTLRTQMRAIYSKTGTNRQAELAHLVSSLPKARDNTSLIPGAGMQRANLV
jgi:DNA-binding CsgD family transcriptional regulator/PAS domain-containing protein